MKPLTNVELDARVLQLDADQIVSRRFKALRAFCQEYEPLSYAVEPLIRSSSIYTLTAKTGHGKTGFLVSTAFAVALGREDILGRPVEAGRVAYIAAENPDDVRMRMMVTAFRFNIGLADVANRIVVLDRRKKPEELKDDLEGESEARGPFRLILADTLAALFDGKDINDNVQLGEFIRRMRTWTMVHGHPSVVVAAHPVKGAARDQLVPYGGGAALNEVDGNLAAWMDGSIMELFTQGKFRGPDFDPIPFRFDMLGSPDVLDVKGRQVQIPVCTPVSPDAIDNRAAEVGDRDISVLRAIVKDPATTARTLVAERVINSTGSYSKATASLAKKGFLTKGADNRWRPTKKGRREVDGENG